MEKLLKRLFKILIIENRLYRNLSDDITQYFDYCTLTYYLSEYFKQYSLYLSKKYKYKSRKVLKELLKKISKNSYGLEINVTWNGIIGILYIMRSLNENKELDNKINYLEKQLENKVYKLFLKKDYKVQNTDFDIISGLAGIGLYYLYVDNDKNIELLDKITFRLLDMLESIDILDLHKLYKPKINIISNSQTDYSISHGILGVIYYLSLYYKKTKNKFVLKIIQQSLQIYIKFFFDKEHNHITRFPSISKYVDENIQFYYSTRTVWCYGSIGSFRGLYLIADNINDCNLKRLVIKEIQNFKNSKISDYNLICPTFCHGLSGLYLILSLFDKENNKLNLQYEIEKLEEKIWSYYDEKMPYCFPKYDDDGKGLRKNVYDNSSFIGGSVSIAVSYLMKNCQKIDKNYFMYSLALK